MGQLSAGLDAIDQILSYPPLAPPRSPQIPQQWSVCFDRVSFSYQGEEGRHQALSELSFTAPQGTVTALVGPSGGGKSTVSQLLNRFWDVGAGQITIGGVDIKDIPPTDLMNGIAAVFQDTYIFADTIWGNITMNQQYSQEQVERAVQAAQCHEFIAALKDGYQTRIGTGGIRLSGGEAQRLSIARAILKDSPIIVLDEALAYSDAENENLIQEAIHNLVRNKTVLIIAHRLQSIMHADQILVLENGSITERGMHKELLARTGTYHSLWNLQHEAETWTLKVEEEAGQ